MGTFRLVLAVAVLIAHVATTLGHSVVNRESMHILVWSGEAVFAFFVISGFYMSLIVNEKYSKLQRGTLRFYANRALRLYPVHWIILILYALYYAKTGTPSFLLGDDREPLARWLHAVVSNTFFLGVETLPLHGPGNWRFVVGPIWSLSIECYFYLLAPFVVMRRLRVLLGFCAAALAFRLLLYHTGVPLLPWRYFFFPADLVFFLIGSVSYRVYAWLRDKPYAIPLGIGAALAIAASVVAPPMWTAPDLDQPVAWAFYALVALGTPALFALTRRSRIDNYLGQLSYPVYLAHILVIDWVAGIGLPRWLDKGLAALVLTLALSAVLYAVVDRPVERLRRRIGAA